MIVKNVIALAVCMLCLWGCQTDEAGSTTPKGKSPPTAAAPDATEADPSTPKIPADAADAPAPGDAAADDAASDDAASDAPPAEEPPAKDPAAEDPKASATEAEGEWITLFNGKSLEGWKPTAFGGEGEVRVEDGEMILPQGATLTGVNYTGEMPTRNYEVELEARRRMGNDFFCGITFPVDQEFASLIVGGWGGSLVGISSINGMDASENNTTKFIKFEKGRWYKIRLRVMDERLQAWIDGDQIIDVDTKDKKLTIRIEVSKSKPFGIASWQTEAGLRNIRLRELDPVEVIEKTDGK